jgi:ABC-type Fe3+/spermidine/putrescine transport system ATPase subunit
MIAGLEIPTAGTIRTNGRDITNTPARSRNMGMVFQNYALFPHLNVFENVAYGLKARKVPGAEIAKRVGAVLDRVQLDRFASRAVHALSGGQQQRVALARALAIEPHVLLLDEPLSNLDPALRGEMREQIRSVIDEFGVTTVFVTHDQQEAFALADRIAIMGEGVCRQVGTPEELYSRPANEFVARFIGDANLVRATRRRGPDGSSTLEIAPGFRIPAPDGPDEPVLVFIRPENVVLGGNGHPGRIVATRFHGSIVRYTVEIGGVRFDTNAFHHGKKTYESGAQVAVSIPEGQFHVIGSKPVRERETALDG